MKKTKKYKVCGVVEFISYDEYAKHGHLKDIEEHPVLMYSIIGGELEEGLKYWKPERLEIDTHYKIIYDYMIKETYTLQEAQEKYPELFL